MTSDKAIVAMRNITKTYGSTRALRGVDFTVEKGEVHALLGRNGAGKSTLVSALSGFTPADTGHLRIGETEVTATGQSYAADIRNDIAHVQQTPRLFNLLTVAENLFLGSASVRNRFGMVSHKLMQVRASKLLAEWNVDIEPGSLVASLDAGTRQLLEIIKALSRGVPVMILDEPTAALSNAEKRILFQHVKTLKMKGISFVYISHHLDEIFEVADIVTIMRDGQVVKAREPVVNLDVQAIANLMMGEETMKSPREDSTQREAPALLQAHNLRLSYKVDATFNFEVRAGEIVALAGPVGGGKEDLAMILAGQKQAAGGDVTSPCGRLPTIGLVPTDRHENGYVGILGVRENVALGGLELLSGTWGFIRQDKESAHVSDLAMQTRVVSSSLEQPVSQLSGGNQQKVVFARALCRSPQVIVAMSPTRGVDVGAKEQLYGLLRDLARKGMGIVIVSDEEDEIEQLANRVAIISEGTFIDELVDDYSLKDLILHMEGVS
jgi:ABC-type sugar transport system ATPase subunit